jgi:hypothetical protein
MEVHFYLSLPVDAKKQRNGMVGWLEKQQEEKRKLLEVKMSFEFFLGARKTFFVLFDFWRNKYITQPYMSIWR